MKKIVRIDGKDYSMKSSAYTQFKYKNDTGRKLMHDMNKIVEMKKAGTDLSIIDDFMEIVLNVAYVMIEESDPKQVNSFIDFLKGINDLLSSDQKWVEEVIELAMSPLSGGSQRNPQQHTGQ